MSGRHGQKPKAARQEADFRYPQIKVPLIFTFRAREKTKQETVNGKKVVTNIGWQPVAPLEIVHTLDLTCILPPRATACQCGSPTRSRDLSSNFRTISRLYRSRQAALRGDGRRVAKWAAR